MTSQKHYIMKPKLFSGINPLNKRDSNIDDHYLMSSGKGFLYDINYYVKKKLKAAACIMLHALDDTGLWIARPIRYRA